MSDLSARYLKNEKLNRRFFELFNGRVYQIHEFNDLWVYQTPKTKKDWLCFPEGITEDEVESLVKRSVVEKKDYVYKATKNTPIPASVRHYNKLIEMGCIM